MVPATAGGISEEECKAVADNLSKLLADTYLLYVKTQNFHWNLTGPRFYSLHKMFEEQYEDLADAVDDIAERIRTLDFRAPASLKEFLELASLKENTQKIPADDMIAELLADHEQMAKLTRDYYDHADSVDDQGSADICAERMAVHEKTAWMLRALLQN